MNVTRIDGNLYAFSAYSSRGPFQVGPKSASVLGRVSAVCLEVILALGIVFIGFVATGSLECVSILLLGATLFSTLRFRELLFIDHTPPSRWGWCGWARPSYVRYVDEPFYYPSRPVYIYRPAPPPAHAGWTRWRPGVPDQA
jgi:hypothetical protein